MKIDKLKLSRRLIRFISLLSCSIFSLIFLFLAGFSYIHYSEVKRQFKKREAYLSNLEEDVKNLKKIIGEYEEEKARFAKLLFSDRDIATFLEEFGGFANRANIKIVDMKVQSFEGVKPEEKTEGVSLRLKKAESKKKEEKGSSLYSLPIKVIVEGNFSAIVDFLLSLEKYRQLLTISNVSIRNKLYPKLSCSFLLRLYSLKELEELKKK